MSDRSDMAWPFYFAKRDLTARRVTYKAGEPFQIQEKGYIRGLAAAYGLDSGKADRMPFSELPYVVTLNVRSQEMAKHIQEHGLTYKQAEKLVGAAEAA